MKKRLTIQEKSVFCNEMAVILSSGMSIQEGLEIVYPELDDDFLKGVVKNLIEDFQMFGTFYEAVKHSGCFDAYMEEMVFIGEQSGNLDDVMYHLSVYYERNDDMLVQLKDAFTYPFVLMLMMMVVIGLFVVKILPIFQNVLLSLGASLSSFVLDMMDFSRVFASFSFVLLLVVCLVLVGFYVYYKLHPEGSFLDLFMSNFFVTKKLYLHFTMANVTYALSLFLSSGYPIEKAVSYLPGFIRHPFVLKKVEAIIEDMDAGVSFEDAIRVHQLYEGLYSNLLQIGFKSGRQDEVMKKLVGLYEKDVALAISSFLNVIEPSIVVLLSVVVGIILLSVMLPLMGVMSSL